ncbi:hypothetical protein LIER_21341 [Lithospermum erythrorhizon]|uniref:Retrotransposon gag domain-containing protein n=1 Tax=Lithospermum erythrorhizon TaxID=34254 RepID=A0AAV3QRF1_LITER
METGGSETGGGKDATSSSGSTPNSCTKRPQSGYESYTDSVGSRVPAMMIDHLKMPQGYQPPKLQQFDGLGNHKQCVAHFIETCDNAGTDGDHMVKQFVCSLMGNAFDWYIELEPASINNWEQLEYEFLNQFFSTRRTISMTELTNAKQHKEEPVTDFINR